MFSYQHIVELYLIASRITTCSFCSLRGFDSRLLKLNRLIERGKDSNTTDTTSCDIWRTELWRRFWERCDCDGLLRRHVPLLLLSRHCKLWRGWKRWHRSSLWRFVDLEQWGWRCCCRGRRNMRSCGKEEEEVFLTDSLKISTKKSVSNRSKKLKSKLGC